ITCTHSPKPIRLYPLNWLRKTSEASFCTSNSMQHSPLLALPQSNLPDSSPLPKNTHFDPSPLQKNVPPSPSPHPKHGHPDPAPLPTPPATLRIHVPIKGRSNVVVNFTRLAEEKYGWAAVNPTAAANLLKITKDADSDDQSDTNPDDTAPEDGSAQPSENADLQSSAPKRQKRRDNKDYDYNDPFIDDAEMLIDQAASKDGFFVFSGPLVQAGQRARIEKIDGTTKRSRGKGSRGGARGANRGAARGRNKGRTSSQPQVES
ncbi:Histone promoter control protein 2, partial [Neolecta irregularis DAH-3]